MRPDGLRHIVLASFIAGAQKASWRLRDTGKLPLDLEPSMPEQESIPYLERRLRQARSASDNAKDIAARIAQRAIADGYAARLRKAKGSGLNPPVGGE